MYQKTYTTDSLPLKRYLNTGQRSKYYAMETHEGIISKTDYEKVQNLLAKKSISNDIAMQVVGVGFIIGVIQDSVETALNSAGDVEFAATAEYHQWLKEGKPLPDFMA